MNKCFLLGRLGADVELKYTSSQMPFCNFTMATSEKYKDKDGNQKESTQWHKIVVWGKLAELCNQYLSKGRQCLVEGQIQTRSYDKDGEKRYITEIKAQNVQFLSGNSDVGEDNSGGEYSNNDIPF